MRFLLLLLLVLLSACSTTGTPERRRYVDGAPPKAVDLSKIAEPVPKYEALARYGNHTPYNVHGKRYELLPSRVGYVEEGIASWYGTLFHGRLTSTREVYDMYQFSAAHKSLPLPAYARVTNLDNGRSIIVRVNDRGPFVGNRVIDLSYVAALKLDIHVRGTGRVRVETLTPGESAPIEMTPKPKPVEPAASAPASGTVPASSLGVLLQVGAFSQFGNANSLVLALQAEGFADARVQTDGALYRVLMGPLPDSVSAEALGAQMILKGFPKPKIIR